MSLKQTAFSAGRWTASSAAFVASIQMVQTMVLARLLAPEEFGLIAVVSAVLAVLALIVDMGLSRALVHFDAVPPSALSSLYWLNLGVALLLGTLLAVAAPLVGALYESPAMVPVLFATSLIFPLTAIGQQFRVLAQKHMRFAALAANEMAATAIGFCIAISVALAGGGVYALVAAMLASAASSSLLAWWYLSANHRPTLHFDYNETRPFLRFGGYLIGDSFANTLNRQADVFIGGLILGPGAIGVYSVPRDLSLKVAMLVNPIITRVGFPVMSRLKTDPERLRSIYLQTLRMTASANFPLYVALGVFAEGIVAIMLGPRWDQSVPFLRIFAAWGLIRSLGNPVGSLLYAVGRARLAFWWNVVLLAICPMLLWMGVRLGGLVGLAWMMLLWQLIIFVPVWFFLVRPSCAARFGEYCETVATPLILAMAAGAVAWLATLPVASAPLRMMAGVPMGGILYLLLSHHFNRSWINSMRELFRLPPLSARHS